MFNSEKVFAPLNSEILNLENLFCENNYILYIPPSSYNYEKITNSMAFFCPNVDVQIFPPWDCLPYDRISPSLEISSKRMNAIFNGMLNPSKKCLFISPLDNLLQKLPPKAILQDNYIPLNIGDNVSRETLLNKLVQFGFNRSATANNSGEFAVRGDIIDIVCDTNNLGYRLSFFGNIIDSIKYFDTESQISVSNSLQPHLLDENIIDKNYELNKNNKHITKSKPTINSLTPFNIYPTGEVILNSQSIALFKKKYRTLFGIQNDAMFEAISNGIKYTGIEHWLPLFYEKLDTIFDYLPKKGCIVLHSHFRNELKTLSEEIQSLLSRRRALNTNENYNALDYQELYLNQNEVFNFLKDFPIIEFVKTNDENSDLFFQPIQNLYQDAQLHKKNVFDLLKEYISELKSYNPRDTKQKKVLICCFSLGALERLRKMLHTHDIHTIYIENYKNIDTITGKTIGIAVAPLENGFRYKNYIFISEQDLLGERLTFNTKRKKHITKFLTELNNFEGGELLVHNDHGIGRFEGLETLVVEGVVHDFIKLNYLGNDKLYVPVENLEILTKYGAENASAPLDKLGASSWQGRKAKLKNKLKIAASELLKISAEREIVVGTIFEPIPELYEQFCQKFLYVETEDQLNAINDVVTDLAKGKPMDRLVCGDVGFGKTEIALRAACVVVCSPLNAQVAIIVPTTLLARQHFKNFSERFADLPIKVAQLSKFVSPKDAKEIKQKMLDGGVDIVIGTHALLASDIKFKNLGLIIVDEEQHFGVGQKEKLKKLKSNTHVLTLSATPIPRTLQMSLSGIKELSLIATPPIDRLPIKTHVMPYDGFIIREAILREQARGGRVFYVTPRIAYLDDIQIKLKEIAPEVKVVKAHGQMPASTLDNIMNDFYDGKYDVLLSTTIVESGLDIPFANTMIVDKADMFGLAQLYQIRGRIGRSNTRAYAYLTTSKGYSLNPTAVKRLNIIQSLEALGSGFNVAAYDMDIRGYGNLVGEEQSGHIKEVGMELYQSMLAEAIEEVRMHIDLSEDTSWSPIINVGVSVQIPEHYISDSTLRLNIYRKMAAINNTNELEAFAAELTDRFGSLPEETEHLVSVIKLKQMAKDLNIEKIDCGEKAVVISFYKSKPKNQLGVLSFVAKHNSDSKLRPDGKLLVIREWADDYKRILGIEKVLSELL